MKRVELSLSAYFLPILYHIFLLSCAIHFLGGIKEYETSSVRVGYILRAFNHRHSG
jgi:hypothetical protein